MSGGANSTTGREISVESVLNSLMMRSPDLGDPVSLLERRILYFISGTPAIQMHIALSRDQCEARSNLRARGSVGTVRPAKSAPLTSPSGIKVMQISQGCNDAIPSIPHSGPQREKQSARLRRAPLQSRPAFCSRTSAVWAVWAPELS